MGRLTPPADRSAAQRERLALRVQGRLEQRSHPRLHMAAIAALTGGVGLLTSFVLLHLGVANMALRYPLATVVAYGAFLLFIWAWLRGRGWSLVEHLPAPDLGDLGHLGHATPAADVVGMGGQFAGAGASGSFAEGLGAVSHDALASAAQTAADTAIDTAVDATADAVADTAASTATDTVGQAVSEGLGLWALIALVVVGAGFLSVLQLIPMAPALLAEVAVDGALSVALFRRLRLDRPHWLQGLVRRTAWRFGSVAIVLGALGYGLGLAAPGSHTLGQAVHHVVR